MLKEEIIRRWKFAEHAYARRQMTWFRKDKRIHWFDISQKKWQDKIKALVNNWKNGRAKSS
jgi:tRNA A37 N6-isopentenylltransferase MiaA